VAGPAARRLRLSRILNARWNSPTAWWSGLRRPHRADRQRPPRTYKELADWTNRLAHALVENYGVKPGNRVLIRSGQQSGHGRLLAGRHQGRCAVVVNTMPMLRAGELTKIVDKAQVSLALCDTPLMDEMVACAKDSPF
jgi:2-aminobenzoate-CoA ligase